MSGLAEISFVDSIDLEIGGIRRVVGVSKIKDLISLISVATLDSNPRKPKRNDIIESIRNELRTTDYLFTYKTRGLLVGSASVVQKSEGLFQIDLVDQQIEGILDGGHNTLAIGLTILEAATGRPSEVAQISDWKSFKTYWSDNLAAVENWGATGGDGTFQSMLIGLEFILPRDVDDPNAVELFRRSIIDICSARNTSTPLKTSTMLGKLGLLEPLKARIGEPYLSRIQWEQNGQGTVKSDDLISMTLVPFKAMLKYLPLASKTGRAMTVKSASSLYAGRTAGVKNYGSLMQSDAITKRTNDYKREIHGPEINSVFDLAASLPEIYDVIYTLFPKAFDANSEVKLMSLQSIIDWNHRYRSHLVLPYSGLPVEQVFPEALIQPLLRALELLIEFDESTRSLVWSTDPVLFLTDHMNDLVKPIPPAFITTYNCAPDQFGKDKHSVVYENVFAQFRRFL